MNNLHQHNGFSVHFPVLCLLAVFFLALSVSAPSANTSEPDRLYHLAKNERRELTADKTIAADRRNWLSAIAKFKYIYRTYQSHPLAPASLFMMAALYHEMYGTFNNKMDLGESIAYYEDIASLYPEHRLADDALFAIAKIYLKERQDSNKAVRYLEKLLKIYPNGDMVTAATAALSEINGAESRKSFVLLSDGKKAKANNPAETVPPQPSLGTMASLKPLRYWSNSNYTRVVIETTTPVKYQENLLQKTADNPRRLYIDLENCRIAPELQAPIPINDGLLKMVRSGQRSPDTTRVVLDTQSLSDYKIFSLQDPFRIVIDLKGQKKGEGAQPPPAKELLRDATIKVAVNGSEDESRAGTEPSLAQQLGLGIRRIILDPGHGGKDSGACGPDGLKEKDIVLQVAKQLARKLEDKLGCEVILTRSTDIFIPLEERTAIANSREGDLFISIHVNAAPTPEARGVETYILAQARSKNAMALAARENATSTSQMSDLQTILLKLIQNSKKSESIKLAEYVQLNMVDGLRPWYPIKNLGVKQAPFIVLVGAEMPAILTEIAFISNPTEAGWLRSADYLDRISDQMVTGITNYSNELSLAYLGFGEKRM